MKHYFMTGLSIWWMYWIICIRSVKC